MDSTSTYKRRVNESTRRSVAPSRSQKKRAREDKAGPASLPAIKNLYNHMIKITVKPINGEAKEFDVYQGLLCSKSFYFRTRLDNDTNVAALELPNVEPRIFAFFVYWLNTGRLEVDSDNKAKPFNYILRSMIDLWLLAQKLRAPNLANAVVAKVLKLTSEYQKSIEAATFTYSFEQTSGNREAIPLRNLFVHIYAKYGEPDVSFLKEMQRSCPHFVACLILRLVELRNEPKSNKSINCSDFAVKSFVPGPDELRVKTERKRQAEREKNRQYLRNNPQATQIVADVDMDKTTPVDLTGPDQGHPLPPLKAERS